MTKILLYDATLVSFIHWQIGRERTPRQRRSLIAFEISEGSPLAFTVSAGHPCWSSADFFLPLLQNFKGPRKIADSASTVRAWQLDRIFLHFLGKFLFLTLIFSAFLPYSLCPTQQRKNTEKKKRNKLRRALGRSWWWSTKLPLLLSPINSPTAIAWAQNQCTTAFSLLRRRSWGLQAFRLGFKTTARYSVAPMPREPLRFRFSTFRRWMDETFWSTFGARSSITRRFSVALED